MVVWKMSENERERGMKDDATEMECVVCFEEFDVGQEVARLECLCRYHKVSCILGSEGDETNADQRCRSVSRTGLNGKAARNVRYMRYMSEYTDRDGDYRHHSGGWSTFFSSIGVYSFDWVMQRYISDCGSGGWSSVCVVRIKGDTPVEVSRYHSI